MIYHYYEMHVVLQWHFTIMDYHCNTILILLSETYILVKNIRTLFLCMDVYQQKIWVNC